MTNLRDTTIIFALLLNTIFTFAQLANNNMTIPDSTMANIAFEEGLLLQDSMLFDSSNTCFMEAEEAYKKLGDWEKYLDCKNERCANLGQLQKLKKVEQLAEEVLQECEEYQKEGKLDQESQQEARAHYSIAKISMIKGKYEDAINKNSIALNIWEKHGNQIKIAESHCLNGKILLKQRKFEEARQQYKIAHEINKNHFATNHMKIIRHYMQIGAIAHDEGKYEEALDLLKKADSMLMTTNYLIYQAYNDNYIGSTYYQKGHFDKAISYFKKSLDIRITILGEDNLVVAESYNNLGAILYAKGEFNEAYDHHNKALDIALRYFELPHKYTASIYHNIGLALLAKKNNSKALENFDAALQIMVSNLDTKNILTAQICMSTGSTYYEMGELDTALVKYSKALDIYGSHPMAANCLNDIGQLKHEQEDYNSAFINFDSARIIQEKKIGQYHPYLARTYNNIASFYAAKAMFDKVTENCAWAKRANLVNPDNSALNCSINTLQTHSPKQYLKSLQLEALNYKYQYKQNNDTILLDSALQVYQQADSLIWKIYKSYTRYEDRLDFTEASTIYQDAMACELLNYKESGNQKNLAKAFYYAEKEKANTLLQSIIESNALRQAGIPENLLIQEYNLKTNIAHYQSQVRKFKDEKNDSLCAIYRNQYLFKAQNDMKNLVKKLEHDYPNYHELKHQQKIVYPNAISEVLDEKTLFVEYIIEEQRHKNKSERKPMLHIFTITKDIMQVTSKAWNNATKDNILKLCRTIKNPLITQDHKRLSFIENSNKLYKQFILPIQNQLSGKQRIVFVGAGEAQNLPFEVLTENDEDKTFDAINFLIKDFEISYHCSATLFKESQSNKIENWEEDLLAIAPVFEDGSQQYTIADRRLEASHLPETETEVVQINNIFHNNKHTKTTVLLHQDANESKLKAHLKRKYRIIHWATHSIADIIDPLFSRIICFQSGNEGEDDILYQNEIFNLKLNADLVVMSSCESGIGKIIQGEGMLGLNRGFLYAGASNIIYTLWEVNDRASAELMISFYEKMITDNKGYASALRDCKLEMLKDEKTALPYLWSSFVLMGQ